MSEKKKARSDKEWMELIQECRASGLPDREWCQLHSISIKTFHNKVSYLRKKACEIPKSLAPCLDRSRKWYPLIWQETLPFVRNILTVIRCGFLLPVLLLQSECRDAVLKLQFPRCSMGRGDPYQEQGL